MKDLKAITGSSLIINSSTALTANTTYAIYDEFQVQGTLTVPSNCTFEFHGGCFNFSQNPHIRLQNTLIIGEGYILKNSLHAIIMSGSTLRNDIIKAEWLGVNSSNSNNAPYIQRAINLCFFTKVRTIEFKRGVFNVSTPVNIGFYAPQTYAGYNEAAHWDINIIGQSNNHIYGTVFKMSGTGVFIVDSLATSGFFRGGSFYHCCFMGGNSENHIGSALDIRFSQTYTVKKCTFIYLENAIRISDYTYYTLIESCIFENCQKGIYSEPATENAREGFRPQNSTDGDANDNIISDCFISECEIPIDLQKGYGWHIKDSDLENRCGTCYIGSYNQMTNVRIERSAAGQIWLKADKGCLARNVQMYAAGEVSPTWRCLLTGDNNRIEIKYFGYHPYALMSYGKVNTLDISYDISTGNYTTQSYYVYDPEDEFIINGYSNKRDYIGNNLIKAVTFGLQNTNAKNVYEGQCYPLAKTNNAVTISCPAGEYYYYKTCKFIAQSLQTPQPENSTLKIFGQFDMNIDSMDTKPNGYGLTIAQYIHKEDNEDLSISFKSTDYDINYYIWDMVISKIPLYNRPILKINEGNTYNQMKTDGRIYLANTYLNSVLTTICLKKSSPQIYLNKLNKVFHTNNANNTKYYEGVKEISEDSGTVLDEGDSYLNLFGTITEADVEIYCPTTGDMVSFHLKRPDATSNYDFTITNAYSTGTPLIHVDSTGTLFLEGLESYKKILWITYNHIGLWPGV